MKTKRGPRKSKKQFCGKPHTIINSLVNQAIQLSDSDGKKLKKKEMSKLILATLNKDHESFYDQFNKPKIETNDDFFDTYTPSQTLRNEQNDEFKKAEEEELKKNEERELEEALKMSLEHEERKQKEEEGMKAIEQMNELQEEFARIKEEPENGVTIAVVLPNMKRIIRKFNEDQMGKDVYIWIAVQEELIRDNIFPIPFTVRLPLGETLDREKSLFEQGIRKKILLSVEVDD